jgi:hypothetical protein
MIVANFHKRREQSQDVTRGERIWERLVVSL